jgi:hypothetical protein
MQAWTTFYWAEVEKPQSASKFPNFEYIEQLLGEGLDYIAIKNT